MKTQKAYIGETNINKKGSRMTIIDKCIKGDSITVKFENGYITNANYGNFKKGLIKNPLDKTIYDIGFIGIKDYCRDKDISNSDSYKCWRDMLYRCYSKKFKAYSEKYVCEEWLNYSIFKQWFDKNKYNIPNTKIHLDKDILVNENKIYSPSTSIFVPQFINQIFQGHKAKQDGLPVGIRVNTLGNLYSITIINTAGDNIYVGGIKTLEEAKAIRLSIKIKLVKEALERYREYMPNDVYLRILKRSEEYEYK